MKWTPEAEAEIKKAPFFVRKKIKSRVEKETAAEGKSIVTISEVKATQAGFLARMDSEIKGYQLETCFGRNGCPNRANQSDSLFKKIEKLLVQKDLLAFLRRKVNGDLKLHHEFRIALADCPNACSQPQIKDIGIIGAVIPTITDKPCTLCGECVVVCKEKAITIESAKLRPEINPALCLKCGLCIRACLSGTISESERGFRVQIGGKLGRHPRLASELPGIHSEADVLNIINRCIEYYFSHSKQDERFAETIFKQPNLLPF